MGKTDVLEREISTSLSGKKLFIANTLNAIWKIYKLNPNDAFMYVSDKLKKNKGTVTPKEYKIAEKASERWADQISSVSFMDRPLVNDFLVAKVNAYGKETDQQIDLFKKFLTLEIIQTIRKVKKEKQHPTSQRCINLYCDDCLPEEVVSAAKKSNIDPKSISAYKSGVRINLDKVEAYSTDWYQQPYKMFDLEWDENLK